ncbi:MAG: tetratricopeptide repeat protein [Flammeovirgaceae bacterium]
MKIYRAIGVMLLLWMIPFSGITEPNCNVYKMDNNLPCYEACVLATEGGGVQGSRTSQENFDQAIAQCPALDYAYMEKSVPYLKRGDFITWKKHIDKAVELNPTLHLGYRGWCRYQFLRDYSGAIRDFEQLEKLLPLEIGYSQNGDYHLTIAKALCYKGLGKKQKAVEIIETQLNKKGYSPGLYEYLHLGVLKMELGDLDDAIRWLNKSISTNDYFAEAYFYLAEVHKAKKSPKLQEENLIKAKQYYKKEYRRKDPYVHPMDQIFLTNIETQLTYISKK